MYLKDEQTRDLVEVLDVLALMDPCRAEVLGRFHSGEEAQEPQLFSKQVLRFPSDESLPLCWKDPEYQQQVRAAATRHS